MNQLPEKTQLDDATAAKNKHSKDNRTLRNIAWFAALTFLAITGAIAGIRYSYYLYQYPDVAMTKAVEFTVFQVGITATMGLIYYLLAKYKRKHNYSISYHKLKQQYLDMVSKHDKQAIVCNNILAQHHYARQSLITQGMENLDTYLTHLDLKHGYDLQADTRYFVPSKFEDDADLAHRQIRMLPWLDDTTSEYDDNNQT